MRKILVTAAVATVAVGLQAKEQVEIRLNQVGYTPQQEKVVVVEGINPAGKLRVTRPTARLWR